MPSEHFIQECNDEISRLEDEITRIKNLTNYLKGSISKKEDDHEAKLKRCHSGKINDPE